MANTVKPYDLPPWARSASIYSYGGSVTKYDLLGVGPINVDTDISAAQIASMSSHLAAIMRVAPLCVVTTQFEPVYGVWTLDNFFSQWGNGLSFAPTLTYGSGYFTLTFDSTYDDEYSQSEAINIKNVTFGFGRIGSTSPNSTADYEITSANVVKIYVDNPDTNALYLTTTIW